MILNNLKKIARKSLDKVIYQKAFYQEKIFDNRILMYHGVDSKNDLQFNFRHVGKKEFEKQIRIIKKAGDCIDVENYFEAHQDGIAGHNKIAITFDDGYRNNLSFALSILEKYECHATIYITSINLLDQEYLWSDMLDLMVPYLPKHFDFKGETFIYQSGRAYRPFESLKGLNLHDFIKSITFQEKKKFFEQFDNIVQSIKSNHSLIDYWKLLSEEEIKTLSKSKYVSIGSHCLSHDNLTILSDEKINEELSLSKAYLENLIQEEVKSIAYPDGAYTRDILKIAEKSGYKTQLAVNYRFEEDENDSRILSRLGVYGYQSLNEQLNTFFH